MMGKWRLYKIECFHASDTPESERLKVTALNLFHPTTSPLLRKIGFLYCDTASKGRGDGIGILGFKKSVGNTCLPTGRNADATSFPREFGAGTTSTLP
jgi:hypothetical protein